MSELIHEKPVSQGSRHKRQGGAVLVVSLILLLVLAVVGISTMGTAIFEIRMASTQQQEEQALRRAERTLLTAETAVDALINTATPFEFTSSGDQFYLVTENINPRAVDWSQIPNTGAGPVTSDNSQDDDDAYVVQYIGERAIPGETLNVDTRAPIKGGSAYLFRNTTRSASGKNAVRILESYYASEDPP